MALENKKLSTYDNLQSSNIDATTKLVALTGATKINANLPVTNFIEDSLTSTSVVKPLSAKQGKVLKDRDSLLLQLLGLPVDLFENYEQVLGINIEQGEEMTFTVDSGKNIILLYTTEGLIKKGIESIIDTNTLIGRKPVILFVEKSSTKLSISGDGQYDIESWINFDVSTKTEIDFLANNFNTAQCDYVLNLIIANGQVSGTHTLNMYYNLSAPTTALITSATNLGWTVNITH